MSYAGASYLALALFSTILESHCQADSIRSLKSPENGKAVTDRQPDTLAKVCHIEKTYMYSRSDG